MNFLLETHVTETVHLGPKYEVKNDSLETTLAKCKLLAFAHGAQACEKVF